VAAFKREVNILMGEALLQSEPPQPQVGGSGEGDNTRESKM
jgi:hypothetical protein